MTKQLKNKVVFITGGGSWIGKEVAKTLANAGAKIFIVGRDDKKLKQTQLEIVNNSGIAEYSTLDITDEQQVKDTVKKALGMFAQIDILVHGAAIYPISTIDQLSIKEWREVIDVNLTGSFIVLKYIAEIMKQKRQGKMIFISSIAGEKLGIPGFAHYTASKAGLNGLIRTAAIELAKDNITVNSINPGNIINLDRYPVEETEIKQMLTAIPMARLGKPLDVASLALFLASDEAGFITGQDFTVDGGETIAPRTGQVEITKDDITS